MIWFIWFYVTIVLMMTMNTDPMPATYVYGTCLFTIKRLPLFLLHWLDLWRIFFLFQYLCVGVCFFLLSTASKSVILITNTHYTSAGIYKRERYQGAYHICLTLFFHGSDWVVTQKQPHFVIDSHLTPACHFFFVCVFLFWSSASLQIISLDAIYGLWII